MFNFGFVNRVNLTISNPRLFNTNFKLICRYFFPLCHINDGSEGTAISSDSSVVEDPSVVDSMVKSVNVAPGEGGTPSGVPPASEG